MRVLISAIGAIACIAGSMSATAATAAAQVGIAVPGVVSTFDDSTTKASGGMGWLVTTDQLVGGSSTATMTVASGGANGSSHSLESSGQVVAPLPYAWAGVMFFPGPQPMQAVNLSAAKAIRFWARGDGRTYHVMMFTASNGQMPVTVDFVAGPEWKEFVLPFVSFGGTDGRDITGIAFTAGPEAGAFKFRIDEVTLK